MADVRAELGAALRALGDYLRMQQALGVSALSLSREYFPSPADALRRLEAQLQGCPRCKLHGGRTTIVFGSGNPNAELVFIGEGPGAEEDVQGKPFVGRAGQLLTKMIESIGMTRDRVYIANIVKCRPPGNRNPEPDEIAACEPFLIAQLQAVQPKVICALGNFAAQTLLKTKEGIFKLRGRPHIYQGITLIPTFHPAYLLRNPNMKGTAWEDLKLVRREVERVRGC